MPQVEVTVIVKVDGQTLAGFPWIDRQTVNEAEPIEVSKAGGDSAGVFTTIPGLNVVPAVLAFALKTDNAVNLKFASVSSADGIIALQGGGMIVIVGANIAAGAALNTLINNTGANAANLKVLSAGT